MVTSFQTLLQPGTLLLIFLTSRFTWRAMLNKVDMVDMGMVDMDMVDIDMVGMVNMIQYIRINILNM